MHTSIINGPVDQGWRGGGEAGPGSRDNNSPRPIWIPLLQPERESGPADGSWNTTRVNKTESQQITFQRLGRLFRGSRTAMLPVISHVTEHQSGGRDAALCAGRGWFTNIAGGIRLHSPPAEQPSAAWGGSRGGVLPPVDTENSFPTREYNTMLAMWCIEST